MAAIMPGCRSLQVTRPGRILEPHRRFAHKGVVFTGASSVRVSRYRYRGNTIATPTQREKAQMYVQRYVPHFPAAGEVIIFDRNWYNRAGVEPVMGFCTPEQTTRFLELTPAFEKAMADSGIILIKYWLEVGPEE
jgi:polyphosphate kinase